MRHREESGPSRRLDQKIDVSELGSSAAGRPRRASQLVTL